MSRFARNVDANQASVVKALRKAGANVVHLHAVGNGVPDLLVGWRGRWVLLELKDGAKVPSARKLTDAETLFHRQAQRAGLPCFVVESAEAAVELLNRQEVSRGS